MKKKKSGTIAYISVCQQDEEIRCSVDNQKKDVDDFIVTAELDHTGTIFDCAHQRDLFLMRPGIEKLLKQAELGQFNVLVVYEPSKLFVSELKLQLFLELMDLFDIAVYFVHEPEGGLML